MTRHDEVPMVMLLHGCTQSPADFATATRFNRLADRYKFVVAYPEQSKDRNPQRCWNWFHPAHQERDHGEPAMLAEVTRQVLGETSRCTIDSRRIYVAGLSAGGAMALVLGATYPDLFAAIGIHSAPPYRSATGLSGAIQAMAGRHDTELLPDVGRASLPPAIVIHGTADRMVAPVNGEQVVRQWLAFHDASHNGKPDRRRVARSTSESGHAPGGRSYLLDRYYSAQGQIVLEQWRVEGLGHAWSGGAAGVSFSDPKGPRASTAMWRFFASIRLQHA